ncbi:pyridoxamine 5'-phosphate oxidase family protein [Thalassomonas actiniarum]|uniref:Pyridoxamine 5'-phosphate oxidase family protein n=1 Tax=Thalassomonas actiniarum TaxID=485447 RepID=A0AAE9YU01_9GAMM|nr:pyridoxamine 5'-phosphate oxidase family protein [Thalassomonas actiniarum]WDE00783.1 pyridoxamine 5'-phosphate oxidase family protein [Thalassomonas actiniarum]
MTDIKDNPENSSPFHKGEQALQSRMGVREQMERFGRRVIRDYMPDQHRRFYQQLPYLFVGHGDKDGWPWASMLFNQPGFITSPDDKTLNINSRPVKGDPLQKAMNTGAHLGLLGIELNTRRRNRLAAHIIQTGEQGVTLAVDQAFGNCPKYIRQRELDTGIADDLLPATAHGFTGLDDQARALIETSDTFFVASFIENRQGEASEGADVSHRGGEAGFVRVDNHLNLTIPDYAGNFHFNTLGNFVNNPRAGLLFIDFENGHMLTLTGRVKLLFDSPEVENFPGAERLWTFNLHLGYWLRNVLDLRWQPPQLSVL